MLLDGPHGWGEFAPFVEYPPPRRPAGWPPPSRPAGAGGRRRVRDLVPVNAIVPAVGPTEAARLVRGSGGCRTAKVKVAEPGQSTGRRRRARAPPSRRRSPTARAPADGVRVDANGAWTVAVAVAALARAAAALSTARGLEYAEQPCATLGRAGRGAPPRRRADRGRRGAPQGGRPRARRGAARGGGRRRRQGRPARRRRGAPCEVAGPYGLPVRRRPAPSTPPSGLAAGRRARRRARRRWTDACGLGSGRLLAADVVADGDRVLPVDGFRVRRPVPGRADLLARLRAAPERGEWWRSRLAAAYESMAGAMNPPSTALAAVVVDELVRGAACARRCWLRARGRPRSPSPCTTPTRDGRLRLHVRTDERSAAFLALGLAKASGGRPASSHVGDRRRQPAPRGARGRRERRAAGRAHRRPAARAAGHRRQPDRRPGRRCSAPRSGCSTRWVLRRPQPGRSPTGGRWSAGGRRGDRGGHDRPGAGAPEPALREPLVPDGDDAWPEPLDGRADGAPVDGGPPGRPGRDELGPAHRTARTAGWPARTLVARRRRAAVGWAADVRLLAESRGWPVVSEPSGNARDGLDRAAQRAPAARGPGVRRGAPPGRRPRRRPPDAAPRGRRTAAATPRSGSRSRPRRHAGPTRPVRRAVVHPACRGRPTAPAPHPRPATGSTPWRAADAAASAEVDRLLDDAALAGPAPGAGRGPRPVRGAAARVPAGRRLVHAGPRPVHRAAARPA